jgi:hypothetical protein
VANDPELTEIYLRGAKPDVILREVVCAGTVIVGAPVCVPHHLYPLLVERVHNQPAYVLSNFIAYRADRRFAEILLERCPTLVDRHALLISPVAEDSDAKFLARLHEFGLLPESVRTNFVNAVHRLAVDEADSSFLAASAIRAVFSNSEIATILGDVHSSVLNAFPRHVERLRQSWKPEYSPGEYFASFQESIKTFLNELKIPSTPVLKELSAAVNCAVEEMEADYSPPTTVPPIDIPVASGDSPLVQLFRDVDE